MEWKVKDFVKKNAFVFLVNFTKDNFALEKEDEAIWDERINSSLSVNDYLISTCSFQEEKINQAFSVVRLQKTLKDVSVSLLTSLEQKKLKLMIGFLKGKRHFVLEHFFDDMIYQEKEIFKRMFRMLVSKKNFTFVFLENDLTTVCESAKGFYLCKGKTYQWITDFYDSSIYQFVPMPETVKLIKYFESCGHKVDHEITFSETLKAIYRGV